MIRFRADTPNGVVIGLGLSRDNVERIQKGEPILVPLKSLGIETEDKVLIFFGETEKEMNREMRKAGLITDDTEQHLIEQPGKKPRG